MRKNERIILKKMLLNLNTFKLEKENISFLERESFIFVFI
jgi:hypothetical protein